MPKKFIPKIPRGVSITETESPSFSKEDIKENDSESFSGNVGEGNVIVIRVKRKREEASRQTLVIGRDESERERKKLLTPNLEMSRLSVESAIAENSPKIPETKVFKLIGTTAVSAQIAFVGTAQTAQANLAGEPIDSAIPGNDETRKIVMRIKEHCKLQERDRNVKRENARHRADVNSRIRQVSSISKAARASNFRRARRNEISVNKLPDRTGIRVIDLDLSSTGILKASSNADVQAADQPRQRSMEEERLSDPVASEATQRRRREIEQALDKVDNNRMSGAASGIKTSSSRSYQITSRSAVVIDDDDPEPVSYSPNGSDSAMRSQEQDFLYDYYLVDSPAAAEGCLEAAALPSRADGDSATAEGSCPVVVISAPELWDDDEWEGELVGEEDEWEDEAGAEDDEDSNAEDHPDNDYPDEPEEGYGGGGLYESGGSGQSDKDEEEGGGGGRFRGRPTRLMGGGGWRRHGDWDRDSMSDSD